MRNMPRRMASDFNPAAGMGNRHDADAPCMLPTVAATIRNGRIHDTSHQRPSEKACGKLGVGESFDRRFDLRDDF